MIQASPRSHSEPGSKSTPSKSLRKGQSQAVSTNSTTFHGDKISLKRKTSGMLKSFRSRISSSSSFTTASHLVLPVRSSSLISSPSSSSLPIQRENSNQGSPLRSGHRRNLSLPLKDTDRVFSSLGSPYLGIERFPDPPTTPPPLEFERLERTESTPSPPAILSSGWNPLIEKANTISIWKRKAKDQDQRVQRRCGSESQKLVFDRKVWNVPFQEETMTASRGWNLDPTTTTANPIAGSTSSRGFSECKVEEDVKRKEEGEEMDLEEETNLRSILGSTSFDTSLLRDLETFDFKQLPQLLYELQGRNEILRLLEKVSFVS
ncbi:hypothetical protein IE53DRAFT_371720 [Violaceomyces palustris]|uniref:Uncharacterized protein n=1 Tax=Violaceomyces palustris TaxID=1673888 RepID=A0ACD0NMS8_9BASI|nr:hypothetical protein IE53DRAFT_371720 [Violaceomyces palustris]